MLVAQNVNSGSGKISVGAKRGFHLSVVERELNHVALMANHKKPTQ